MKNYRGKTTRGLRQIRKFDNKPNLIKKMTGVQHWLFVHAGEADPLQIHSMPTRTANLPARQV